MYFDKPGKVVLTYNPCTGKAEEAGASLVYIRFCLKTVWGMGGPKGSGSESAEPC